MCVGFFRIGRAFGPSFSGLTVNECSIQSTRYPGDSTGEDAGIAFRPLVFARGISNELVCDELLFDFHRGDFRPGSTPDFDVPDINFTVAEKEQTVDDKHQTQSEYPAAEDAILAGHRVQAQSTEAKPKKPVAKPHTTKTGAATGGATKGGASKGKVSAVKKKR